MNDEELEQEDLEMSNEEGEELNDDANAEEADDEELEGDAAIDSAERITPVKKSKSAEDTEDLPTPEAKQRERDELARAIEAFLAKGGKVQEIEPNVVADPPKKPDSKYGSRPI